MHDEPGNRDRLPDDIRNASDRAGDELEANEFGESEFDDLSELDGGDPEDIDLADLSRMDPDEADAIVAQTFGKLLDLVEQFKSSLDDLPPIEGELKERYDAVVRDTDAFAERFFGDYVASFMANIAHRVALYHPDRFLSYKPDMWASAIKSYVSMARTVLPGEGDADEIIGASGVLVPGVPDLVNLIQEMLPVPDAADDPEMRKLLDVLAELYSDGEPGEEALDEDEDEDPSPESYEEYEFQQQLQRSADEFAARVPDDSSILPQQREYYEQIVLQTDAFSNAFFDNPMMQQIMRHFARLAVRYGDRLSLECQPHEVALYIIVMMLGLLKEQTRSDDEVGALRKFEESLVSGREDLILELQATVGSAIKRGLDAEPLPDPGY